jgi:peptide/nickel transport system substrate-binding protein
VRATLAAVAVAAAAGPAGCGWGEEEPAVPNAPQAQRGGTLTVLGVDAPAGVDPHRVAGPAAAMLHAIAHRTPYTHRPGDDEAVADLAEGAPEVSEDGRTVTVGLRAGARFGPDGETINADDVEHGLERALADPVAGPPARRLLGDLVGLPPQVGDWRDVPGIEALDARTLELRLERPSASLAIAALATPAATPLPADEPRVPGPLPPDAVAYSGPYLPRDRLPADERGEEPLGRAEAGAGQRLVPAVPAGALTLVRNPEWDGAATPTPAYVERVVVGRGEGGGAATSVLDGSRALWAGENVPADVLRRAERRPTPQLVQVAVPVTRFVALNAARAPFDDRLVRRAAVAALDRVALWEAAGGRGEPASHWLPPGVPGHDRSGGSEGLGVAHLPPAADPGLAAELLRRAGFAEGRYEGPPILALAADLEPERAVAREAVRQLEGAGFEVDLELTAPRDVEARCQAPDTDISLCPGAALASPEGEPGAILRAGFGGAPQGAAAEPWSHLDAPSVDLAIAEALAARESRRPGAWADVNRAVAQEAAGAPWRWDERPLLRAREVRGVVDERRGTWALGWTWLGSDAEQDRVR